MKRFWQAILIALVVSIAAHFMLWGYGRELYYALKEQTQTAPRSPQGDISVQRKMLEKKQKENLNNYKWIDQRKGYVQIPVDRAFDYYLKSLP